MSKTLSVLGVLVVVSAGCASVATSAFAASGALSTAGVSTLWTGPAPPPCADRFARGFRDENMIAPTTTTANDASSAKPARCRRFLNICRSDLLPR